MPPKKTTTTTTTATPSVPVGKLTPPVKSSSSSSAAKPAVPPVAKQPSSVKTSAVPASPPPVPVKREEVDVKDTQVSAPGSADPMSPPAATLSALEMLERLVKQIDGDVEKIRDASSSCSLTELKNLSVKILRNIHKQTKGLKPGLVKLSKNQRKSKVRDDPDNKLVVNMNSGLLKPVPISDEMAKFAGWERGSLKSRTEVTKFICNYIKTNGLNNDSDRRQIKVDDKLGSLLKYDPVTSTEPLTYYRIQTYLKHHFV